MKLSIVIVSWNVKEDLRNCLNSIKRYHPKCNYEIIVVDNGSTDSTAEMIGNNFSEVTFISNERNLGFAGGNNQGIKIAKGQYILLLNPDTLLKPESLDGLVEYIDKHPDVGACGPKLYFENGKVQQSVRRFPSMRGALHRYTFLKSLKIFRSKYNHWLIKDFNYDATLDVDQIMGAAFMVRKAVLDNIGCMDEKNFFMYYEEVDLCYRIKKAGWRIVFIPDVEIVHLGGRSSEQIPAEKMAMAMKSLFRYFKKHRSRTSYLIFSIIFIPLFIIRELGRIVLFSILYLVSIISSQNKLHKRAFFKLITSIKLLFYSLKKAIK